MLCSLQITPSETPLLGSGKGHGASTDSPAALLASLCGHSLDFCLPTLYGVRHLPLLFSILQKRERSEMRDFHDRRSEKLSKIRLTFGQTIQ